jgi:gluconate 5-dehydrogenase
MEQALSTIEQLFSLRGKAALVTGASGGIGRALAVGLAGAGAAVALSGRDLEDLEITRAEIEARGGRCVVLPADVREVETCRALVADAAGALGGFQILVNCAGINRRKPVEEVTTEDFDTVMAVNLRSVYFLCQAAFPVMRDAGGGKIIQIGSVTSFVGLAAVSVYGATKAAIAQLTKTLAVEWACHNIQVNCLVPGFIMTPLTEQGLWGNPRRSAWLLDRIPARRPGEPRDLVGAVLLLASPASDYMTGQTVTVDGGFLAGSPW